MPQTFDEEMYRSIWSKDIWSNALSREAQEPSGRFDARKFRLAKVRDYKDQYILNGLQKEARSENPGFHWYDRSKQEAVLVWTTVDGMRVPSGYSLMTHEHYVGGCHPHWYPRALNQLYVSKLLRRNGVGMRLLLNFITNESSDKVWIESPKWETREMLEKVGYSETQEPYEVWQMREGLTLWERKRPQSKT